MQKSPVKPLLSSKRPPEEREEGLYQSHDRGMHRADLRSWEHRDSGLKGNLRETGIGLSLTVLLLGLFVAVTSDPVPGNCLEFAVFTHEIRLHKDLPNGEVRRSSALQRYIWDSIIYPSVADFISSKNSPVDQRMGILLLIKKPKHKTLRYKIK